jgi:hypothetical protein
MAHPLRASNPNVAHGVGVPSDQIIAELSIFRDGTAANQDSWLLTNPNTSSLPRPNRECSLSGKRLADIERNLVFHNVITSPTQLVRHRFDRRDAVGLGFFPLVKALDVGTEPNREVGRLDIGPGQILVAVLSVAAAFFLAVTDLLTPHTPTVGGVVSYGGKPADITRLQHDRQ